MRKVILVFAGFLVFCFNLYSQVNIKEKVEIKPMSPNTYSQTGDDYLPCGPYKPNTVWGHFWQVVWGGYFGPLDPFQQLFGLQSGEDYSPSFFVSPDDGPYTIKIIEGITYCTLQKLVPIDEQLRWYKWQDTPWPDSLLIFGSDLIGDGSLIPYNCVYRYMDQKYQIKYNYPVERDVEVVYSLTYGDTTRYYHTLVKKRGFRFNTRKAPLIIPYGEELNASISPVGLLCTPSDPTPEGCFGYDDIRAGGGLPDYSVFNISIVEGNEYGTLAYHDNNFNLIMNDSFTNLSEYYYNDLSFEANGVEPADTGYVKIHYECTGITPMDVIIKVISNKTYQIKVQFNPTNLAPGETADITLLKRYGDYSIEHPETVEYGDFPADQLFNVNIVKGREYGTLISADGLLASDELENTEPGFKFIAVDSIDVSSALVNIEVTCLEYEGIASKSIIGNNSNNNQQSYNDTKNSNNSGIEKIDKDINSPADIIIPANWVQNFGIGKTLIVKESIDILLGESKYFQAKYNESGQLIIEEVNNNLPKLNGGVENVSWELNIFSGNKLGVYWETEKPIWNTSEILAKGLIRVIGRYWEQGLLYKVSLTAKENDNSASIFLVVTKPDFLYSSTYKGSSFAKSKDVFDTEYSVDELCITIGGTYGIPPQFIKGHMAKESAKKNFGNYWGFAPSYRYEPFTTQFNSSVNDQINGDNPFVVKENSMGNPNALGVPTQSEHKHVLFIHYPELPTTVWDIVNDNSQLTNPDNPSTFGYRYKDGSKAGQVRSGYTIYREYVKVFLPVAEKEIKIKYKINPNDELDINKQIEANNLARERFVDFLKDDWNGGLKNTYAQTRIAASYGLLQSLFTTAIDEGLPIDNTSRPELLNEPSGFIYNIYHYISLFENYNGFLISTSNNWVSSFKNKPYGSAKSGFEEALKVIAYLWNPGEKDQNTNKPIYHIGVFNNMENFLPGVTK